MEGEMEGGGDVGEADGGGEGESDGGSDGGDSGSGGLIGAPTSSLPLPVMPSQPTMAPPPHPLFDIRNFAGSMYFICAVAIRFVCHWFCPRLVPVVNCFASESAATANTSWPPPSSSHEPEYSVVSTIELTARTHAISLKVS